MAVSPGAVSAFAPLDAHQGGRWLVAQADGSLHALLLKSSNAGVDKVCIMIRFAVVGARVYAHLT